MTELLARVKAAVASVNESDGVIVCEGPPPTRLLAARDPAPGGFAVLVILSVEPDSDLSSNGCVPVSQKRLDDPSRE